MLALHERAENDSFKEELYKALNAWYSLDLPLGLPNLLYALLDYTPASLS